MGDSPEAMQFFENALSLPFIREKREKESFERIPGLAYTHEERIAAIDRSMADIAAGRTIPHEEIMKPYRQWL
jgi:hypothetical protein